MARDPNGPIPGFEDEYTGTAGNEKTVHKTHFTAPGTKFSKDSESEFEWVEVRPGRWRLREKDA